MERTQVIRVLECVANGINPQTGDALDGVFATPVVIRALFTAVEMIKTTAEEQQSRRKIVGGAGTRWSSEEDVALTIEYDEGMSILDIASKHSRTPTAITMRLIKLGRVPAPDGIAASVQTSAGFLISQEPGLADGMPPNTRTPGG